MLKQFRDKDVLLRQLPIQLNAIYFFVIMKQLGVMF